MIPAPVLRALRAYVRHAPGSLGKPLLAARLLNEQLTRHPLTATARTRSGTVFPVVTSDIIQRFIWLFGVWELT